MRNEIIRDGKTRYLYTAFADTATGENMQTQPYEGYAYIGSFESEQIETETDPTKYKWMQIEEPEATPAAAEPSSGIDIQEILNDTIRTATLYADAYMQVKFEGDEDTGSGALIIKRETDNYNVKIDGGSVEIRDGETPLTKISAEKYTTEQITSYQTYTTTWGGNKIAIFPAKSVAAVISCKDNNGDEIPTMLNDPDEATVVECSDHIIISPDWGTIALPITLTYVSAEDSTEIREQASQLEVGGTAKVKGTFIVDGMTLGVLTFQDFEYDIETQIKAGSYTGVSIYYNDIALWEHPNMVPIGIISWGIIGSNNTYVNLYRIDTNIGDTRFAYFGLANTKSSAIAANTLTLKFRVLYASCRCES